MGFNWSLGFGIREFILYSVSVTHTILLQIIGACALLAAIPASAWGFVFYKKAPEDRRYCMLSFAIGALAVFPILFYRWLWQYFPWMNVLKYTEKFSGISLGFENFIIIPLSVILTFMVIGLIEEVMKQSAVHAVDDLRIKDIDDAITFSIFVALGFSFTENIIYFYNIWIVKGPESLFIPFAFRSVFSTFAHLLFSGVFGYFYGIAHFAKPILQEELLKKRNVLLRFFHGIFKFKTAALFHEEKMLEGLSAAIFLHAIYNVFLEMNWTFLMVPYLVFGYMYLSRLMKKKENHKKYDLVFIQQRNNEAGPKRVARMMRRIVRRSTNV